MEAETNSVWNSWAVIVPVTVKSPSKVSVVFSKNEPVAEVKSAMEAEFVAISVAIEALVEVNAPEIFASNAYEPVALVKVLMLFMFIAMEAEFVVISVAIEALVEVNAPEIFASSAYEPVALVKVLILFVFVVMSVAIEALVDVNAPEMSVAI